MKIVINLNEEAVELIQKEVNGSGGWQSLLRALQNKVNGNELELGIDEVSKLLKYTHKYGQGGFEDRLKPVLNSIYELVNAILDSLRIDY